MATNVPKFASFRPKLQAAPEPPKEAPERQAASGKSTRKEKSRERRKSPVQERQETRTIAKDEPSSKLYFSDRRGDADVLRYGALNRYDLPAYRRFGYGYVLGLSSDQKIDRAQSSDTKIYITPAKRQRQERLLTRKNVPKDDARALRFIKGSTTLAGINDDFIPISDPSRRTSDKDGEDDGKSPHPDYRDLEMKRTSDQPVDEDTRYDLDEPGDTQAGREVRIKHSELVRKTRETPGDIQAWLGFIGHQEAMMLIDSPTTGLSDAARRQLADVRIPIYEEALKKLQGDPENSVLLYEGLLQEARRSWSETKLSAKWKDVLAKHPRSTRLWFIYLDYIQSNFSPFKYEMCRSTFLGCLKAIQDDKSGATIETTLHVFLRMTTMIQSAGYQELALAIWQALLEYHVMAPGNTEASIDDLVAFEEFWEGEAPRIGEVGANGWRKPCTESSTSTTTLLQKGASDSVFEDFRKRETDCINKLRYPGRTPDEAGEDDAFHTIFFADIEEYLGIIPVGTSISLLVEAFLCFCRLPPLPQSAIHQSPWWRDPFLSQAVRQTGSLYDLPGSSSGMLQKIAKYSTCGLESIQMTSDILFKERFILSGTRIQASFMRRLLKLVTTSHPSKEVLGEYLLAFEFRHFPSDAFKTAKQLLKARPTSQRLYNAYGIMESQRGKTEKANQVFSMARSVGDGSLNMYDSLGLLSSWVWEALNSADQGEALWRLVSTYGRLPPKEDMDIPPDQASMLHARSSLGEACEKALLRQDFPCAVVGTSLLALLAYLSNDRNAEAAITAHQNLSSWFALNKLSTSPHVELNAQAVARLLTYHVTYAPIVKPALIRSALEPLIASFPDNTILLSLYAANEARFSIDDRVRGIMHRSALHASDSTTIAGWCFAINFETMRGEIAGSTSHSIRALYKRATHGDASGAHAPALWGMYLRFEIAQLQIERAKNGKRVEEAETRVKETFYAGLRSVPWCKDFTMLVFTEVRGVFGEQELWKVYRVMQEKEIRLYVELD